MPEWNTRDMSILHEEEELDVKWEIVHLEFLTTNYDIRFFNPLTSFDGQQRWLFIMPWKKSFNLNGREKSDSIILGLSRGSDPTMYIKVSFTFKTVTGKKILKKLETKLFRSGENFYFDLVLSQLEYSIGKSQLLVSGFLVAVCRLKPLNADELEYIFPHVCSRKENGFTEIKMDASKTDVLTVETNNETFLKEKSSLEADFKTTRKHSASITQEKVFSPHDLTESTDKGSSSPKLIRSKFVKSNSDLSKEEDESVMKYKKSLEESHMTSVTQVKVFSPHDLTESTDKCSSSPKIIRSKFVKSNSDLRKEEDGSVKKYKKSLEESQRKNRKLKAQLFAVSQELEKNQREFTEAVISIKKIQEKKIHGWQSTIQENIWLKSLVETKKNEISQLASKLLFVSLELEKNRREHQEAMISIMEKKTCEMQSTAQENTELKRVLETKENEISQLKDQLLAVSEKLEKSQSEPMISVLERKTHESQSIPQDNSQLKSVLEAKENEISQLKDQLLVVSQESEKNEREHQIAMTSIMEKKNHELQSISDDNIQLRIAVENKKNEISELMDKLLAVSQELEKDQDEYVKSMILIKEKTEELQSTAQENTQLKSVVETKENENRQLRDQLLAVAQALETEKNQREHLESQILIMEKKSCELQSTAQENILLKSVETQENVCSTPSSICTSFQQTICWDVDISICH